MKKYFVIFILLLVLILTSCTTFQATKYSISGTVLDSSQNPIANATVSISKIGQKVTNSQGQFSFTNVLAGNYTLTISKDTYYPITDTLLIDQNVTSLNYTLTKLPTYSLNVSVIDDTSNSSVNATVTLFDSGNNQVAQKTGTNVTFEQIYEGNYSVKATASNYFENTKTVNLTSNKSLTIALTPTSYVSGYVKDASTSDPIANANVTINNWSTTTNSNGYYNLEVQKGNFTLTISKSGYSTHQQSISITGSLNMPLIQLQPLLLNIKLTNKANNAPITDATVKLTYMSTNQVVGTKTGSNISFNIPGFGNYKVDITHANYKTYSETRNITANNSTWEIQLETLSATASGTIGFGNKILPQNFKEPTNVKTISLLSSDNFSVQSLPNHQGILVQFHSYVTTEEAVETLTQFANITFIERGDGVYLIQNVTDIYPLMESLRQMDNINIVQPNRIFHLMGSVPNDANYSDQWHLGKIGMENAWDYSKGKHGNVIVAVLDTGIKSNTDLNANIVPGYNVVANNTNTNDDISEVNQSHGTHMASIIAAVTDNTTGLAGTGWNLQVMPIKICYEYVNGVPVTDDAFLRDGIIKAVDLGAKVINISLGDSQYPDPADHALVETALQYAYNHGVSVIAATGNGGNAVVSYPASSQYTIAVGATDHNDNRAAYSNYGTGLTLVAPGGHANDSLSAYTYGIAGYPGSESGYYVWAGTSSATAQVSAVAGLIYTLGITNPDRVFDILVDSATSKSDAFQYGAGVLNAWQAMLLATNQHPFSITDAKVYAAVLDNNYLVPVTNIVSPNGSGNYSISNIPIAEPIYIAAYIDVNGNGVLEIGEYVGQTDSYIYSSGESRSSVNFEIFKITADYFDSMGVTTNSIAIDESLRFLHK